MHPIIHPLAARRPRDVKIRLIWPITVILLGSIAVFWQRRPMSLVGNIVIALVLAGFFLGGGALFFIARQDDSHAGRVIGILSATAGVAAAIYLTAGHHWL